MQNDLKGIKKTRKQEQVTKSHDMTIGCKHREIKPESR